MLEFNFEKKTGKKPVLTYSQRLHVFRYIGNRSFAAAPREDYRSVIERATEAGGYALSIMPQCAFAERCLAMPRDYNHRIRPGICRG